MAYTLYGPADADRIKELAIAADVVFAEYGAGGGPSLSLAKKTRTTKRPQPPPPPPGKKAGKRDESASKS